jgi:hypothetical protein
MWKLPLSAKLPVISHPQFTLSLLEVSHIVVNMGVPGGASGNFQSRVSTISLYDYGTSEGNSNQALPEEETNGSGDRASLSIGILLGNVEWTPLPGTLNDFFLACISRFLLFGP